MIGHALRAVAAEMGAVLVRSAFSANIKERRDCSTAIFDERGRMIAQAEHIPVHLGAMPDAVAAVMEHEPTPDDVYVLNDPYAGGTHLPDITLVSRTQLGFAATRAHHADVGGIEPGSLPAASRTLAEEGVVVPPTRLDDDVLEALVARMRNAAERRGDLRAQLAAHRLADRRLDELVARRGAARVHDAMDELYAYSERLVRRAIAALPDGRYEAVTSSSRPKEACSSYERRSRSRVTRLRSTSQGRRRSSRGTSTARCPSRVRPATSSCAVSPTPTSRLRAARSRPSASARRSAAS